MMQKRKKKKTSIFWVCTKTTKTYPSAWPDFCGFVHFVFNLCFFQLYEMGFLKFQSSDFTHGVLCWPCECCCNSVLPSVSFLSFPFFFQRSVKCLILFLWIPICLNSFDAVAVSVKVSSN
jgi:hypothetical protein